MKMPGRNPESQMGVEGRVNGAKTVTITKNGIIAGLNRLNEFILARSILDGDRVDLRSVRQSIQREPDFRACRAN